MANSRFFSVPILLLSHSGIKSAVVGVASAQNEFLLAMQNLSQVAFKERIFTRYKSPYAILEFAFPGSAENHIRDGWLGFDIVRLRSTELPDVINTAGITRDLEIGNDESLCERTACVVDTRTGHIGIQAGSSSISPYTIARYLKHFLTDPDSINISIIPDRAFIERLAHARQIVALKFKVSLTGDPNDAIVDSSAESLRTACNAISRSGATSATISIQAGLNLNAEDRKGWFDAIARMLPGMRDQNVDQTTTLDPMLDELRVDEAKVTVLNEEGRKEVIEAIGKNLTTKVTLASDDMSGRFAPFATRLQLISSALTTFQAR